MRDTEKSSTITASSPATIGKPGPAEIATFSQVIDREPAYAYVWEQPAWRTTVDDTTLGEAD